MTAWRFVILAMVGLMTTGIGATMTSTNKEGVVAVAMQGDLAEQPVRYEHFWVTTSDEIMSAAGEGKLTIQLSESRSIELVLFEDELFEEGSKEIRMYDERGEIAHCLPDRS